MMVAMLMSATFLDGVADITAPFAPDSSANISSRVILSQAPEYSFFNLPWQNPATRQFQAPFSISAIHLNYSNLSAKAPVSLSQGSGEWCAEVGAYTYLKHKSSTLWGDAYYDNGRQLGIKWNETSDSEMLYPYLTADSIGGNMNLERYRFMGGYADHKKRWSWGAQIGYLAGLYYRSIDPRPKNITGLLSLSAGAGYRIAKNYSLSLGLMAQRYQQSNEITFMSETYESKIYHATGLGTHYVRFAGTGKNSKYTGWRYGGGLQFIPVDTIGFIAAVEVEAFEFEKILTDLNRLPLAKANDLDISAEAGYHGVSGKNVWMVGANLSSHSRKGKENIFGDPSMSIYPQITTLDKYSASTLQANIKALWSLCQNDIPMISVKPVAGYVHNEESYINPDRQSHYDAVTGDLIIQGAFRLPWKLSITASLHGSVYAPISSSIHTDGQHLNDDQGLTQAWMYDFSNLEHVRGSSGASLSVIRPINHKFALQIFAAYHRHFLPLSNHANIWQCSLSLLF